MSETASSIFSQEDGEDDDNGKDDTSNPFSNIAQLNEERIDQKQNVVMRLTNICETYRLYLTEEGINATNYKACQLKSKILVHLGSRLAFHSPHKRNETLYVFSSTLNPGSVTEQCEKLEAAAAEQNDSLLLEHMPLHADSQGPHQFLTSRQRSRQGCMKQHFI